jgi:hypothetical protein
MFGSKKESKQPVAAAPSVPTDEQYWAKRDAQRQAWEAQQKQKDVDSGWEGYAPQTETLTPTELAALFNYELSAYNDTVGYYADGIERVCPFPRKGTP